MPTKAKSPDDQPAGVTMADASALNGVPPKEQGAARLDESAAPGTNTYPDAGEPYVPPTNARSVRLADAADVFVSEGMRNDIEAQGWAVDPNTGIRVTKD
jgi:hypothetical protein